MSDDPICKGDCSRQTVQYKKQISDQVSACTQGGRQRMDVYMYIWWVVCKLSEKSGDIDSSGQVEV